MARPMRPGQRGWHTGSEQQASGSSASPSQTPEYFSYYSTGKSPLDVIRNPNQNLPRYSPQEDSTFSFYSYPYETLPSTGSHHPVHIQHGNAPYASHPLASSSGPLSDYPHYDQNYALLPHFEHMSITSQPQQQSSHSYSRELNYGQDSAEEEFDGGSSPPVQHPAGSTPQELAEEELRIEASHGPVKAKIDTTDYFFVELDLSREGLQAFYERLGLLRAIYNNVRAVRCSSKRQRFMPQAFLAQTRIDDANLAITQLTTFEAKWNKYENRSNVNEPTSKMIKTGSMFNRFLAAKDSHLLMLGVKLLKKECKDFLHNAKLPDNFNSAKELAFYLLRYLEIMKPNLHHRVSRSIKQFMRNADDPSQQSEPVEHDVDEDDDDDDDEEEEEE